MNGIRATVGSTGGEDRPVSSTAELVETTIGDAIVYFRVDSRPLVITSDTEVRPVALDANAFEAAAKVVRGSSRHRVTHSCHR